jgi:hypothetical protein
VIVTIIMASPVNLEYREHCLLAVAADGLGTLW